jgi:hypothetical protein
MKKLKGNNWNKYANKMSNKINKIMNEKLLDSINIEEEYRKIQNKESKLSANMRDAVTYQFLNKNLKK